MNRKKGWKLLREKWGDKAVLRHNEIALVGEEKAAANAALRKHREQKPAGREKYMAWKAETDKLFAKTIICKYDAGYLMTIPGFGETFSIQGSGDTIEEAVTKAISR